MSKDVYNVNNENQLKHIYEPDQGLFIAESPNVIERALNAGYVAESFLVEERYINGPEKELIGRCPEAEVYLLDKEMISSITGYPMTRGMLAAMKRKPLPDICKLLMDKKRVVILEEVMNPTNLGAIFRSAAALGIEAVVLTSGCTDPLYRRSVRVSMGTVFQIPWTIMSAKDGHWIDTDGELLRELGYKLVSMALRNNTVDISNDLLKGEDKLAIIMGTEGEGLDNYTIDKSDYTVKIPMSHGVDSLNVAAASAIAFWELGIH